MQVLSAERHASRKLMSFNPALKSILTVGLPHSLNQALDRCLAEQNFTTVSVPDGYSALSRLAEGEFAAAVIADSVSDIGVLDLIRELRAASDFGLLVVSSRPDEMQRVLCLELGADDFVDTNSSAAELRARVRAILRRLARVDHASAEAEVETCGDLVVSRPNRRVEVSGSQVALTGAEFIILDQLLRARGQVVSKDELAEAALGRRLAPHDRSIDTHVSRLRRKLGPLPDGSARIQTVRGRGYLIP